MSGCVCVHLTDWDLFCIYAHMFIQSASVCLHMGVCLQSVCRFIKTK